MDGLLRGLATALFAIGLTWGLAVVLSRLVLRKGFVPWVWDRSGAIGRILVLVGFGIAVLGLTQGQAGTSLILLGSIAGMAGIWLVLPGP